MTDKTPATLERSKTSNALRWVPSVYFAMGLPFVALNLVSVIMFADLGIGEAEIAFWTSLLTLPYTLKFLWSPLLEIYWTKRNFVVATQALSGFSFALIAFLLPIPGFFSWTIAAMWIIAFSGATHDIATDGIYLSSLNKETQSRYIGWQGAFYNLAKVLANGGLVWLAGYLIARFKQTNPENAPFYAWMIIMALLGALLIGLAIYHFFVLPKNTVQVPTKRNASESLHELTVVLTDFFRKPNIWLYIAFIICFRLTEGFAMKMVPLFLKAPFDAGGLQLGNEEIGLIYGTFGTIAFIIGSILGGYYIARFGLKKVMLSLVAIFNVPFVIYLALAVFQPVNLAVIGIGLVTEYFCYGFGFVGLTLFMMQQVAPGKHSMSHYAFASAIMNLGVMLPGMISGWICEKVGYETFFIISLIMAVPVIAITFRLPFNFPDKTTAEEALDTTIESEQESQI